jgi:hypothetical protein
VSASIAMIVRSLFRPDFPDDESLWRAVRPEVSNRD